MTKILVCWSGGCDSTLLLFHAARAYGTPKSPVRALSITSDQVSSGPREAAARKKILAEFKKRGLHVAHSEMSLTCSGDGLNGKGLPQAVMWLVGTQFLLEDETYGLGYIKGDDWVAHKAEFEETFRLLQRVSDRTGSIWTPLSWTEKRGVIHQLRQHKLLKLTWWCEVPPRHKKATPCGDCHSCMTHETAVWKLDKFGPGTMWAGD